jgi:predicted ATP-grasp superfamily ATP-dependent carboligase
MIQRYVPDAANEIYVLAAFIDREGSLFATRSGVKIFQRPRRLGIGLCFEEGKLPAEVIEGARRLARATGYYGLFQLEFIKTGGRYLLIDFNPRFYNQLAFDMARGLPIPEMVHAAACGSNGHLADLVSRARVPRERDGLVFCNEFGLNFVLAAQHIAKRVSSEEMQHWRRWHQEHRGSLVDPARSHDDPLPAVVDVLDQLSGYARHPRAFLRSIVFGAPSR